MDDAVRLVQLFAQVRAGAVGLALGVAESLSLALKGAGISPAVAVAGNNALGSGSTAPVALSFRCAQPRPVTIPPSTRNEAPVVELAPSLQA
jgi:hypothetical protein